MSSEGISRRDLLRTTASWVIGGGTLGATTVKALAPLPDDIGSNNPEVIKRAQDEYTNTFVRRLASGALAGAGAAVAALGAAEIKEERSR